MAIPERVRIGPYEYAINTDADALMRYEHAEQKVWGAIRYKETDILIDAEASDQKQRVTLLHEVMHGCDHIAGTSHLDNEEQIVVALAHTLLDTLRRNPDLVLYLLEDA